MACRHDLPWIRTGCKLCGKPLPIDSICGECQQKAPIYAQSRIAFGYAYPVNLLIQRLKFSHRLDIASSLAALLAAVLDDTSWPEYLVPVPMHRSRLRERGYNQAGEIARCLSRLLGIPLAQDCCRRIRHTAAQSGLPAQRRRGNVRGAFRIGEMPTALHHVAIVDDVVTTGATVSELARTLRGAGVEKIEVWACARTGRSGGRQAQVSRLVTERAFTSMKSRRGST